MRARLVGTWGARSADELVRVLQGPGAAASDVVELRLDLPRDGAARVREILSFTTKPVLATCRRASEGGGFTAGERDRIDVLLRAADAGAAWLDVEDDVPDRDVERLLGSGAKLLRSRHVPRLGADAEDLAARLVSLPGHAAKLVALHGDDHDALRMLTLVRDAAGRLAGHVVDAPFTRVGSAALGAPFVYAALQPGGRIGLAIPTVLHLCRRCDLRRVAPGGRLFVLLGADVEAAVSTDILNVMLGTAGLDVVAARWSCADPEPALEAVRRFGWAGAAVTIPHKERVRDRLSGSLGPTATECGAVNTVVLGPSGLTGHNTDLGGLGDALAPRVAPGALAGRTLLVLGAGGAARAAVAHAIRSGADPVVFARRPGAAAGLGARVARTADEAVASRPAVVVNATPTGPPGGTPFLDPASLPDHAVVLDMQVFARPTALLAAAARAGHDTVPGFDMLVAQAARQVALLGGRPDPETSGWSRRAGESALRRRDAPIVLVGLRCAGKTTVGERLAAMFGRAFVDTDLEVGRRAGRSVEDMLRAGEEAAFRAVEEEVLRAAIDAPGAVIACGGGAALHRDAFAALAAWGTVVLLDASDDVLLARRSASPRTPLTKLPAADELARQRAARMPVYEGVAALRVDVGEMDAEAVADVVAGWWDALPV